MINYEDDKIFINSEQVQRVARYKNANVHNFADVLYPSEAIEILRMQAVNVFSPTPTPVSVVDDNSLSCPSAAISLTQQVDYSSTHLDSILGAWLKLNVSDPLDYLAKLFDAIQKRHCLAGLCVRLNLACLTEPTTDNTIITRHDGHRIEVKRQKPHLDYIPADAHFQVKRICSKSGFLYTDNAKQISDTLESFTRIYDLEQVLLVRIAYLAVHSQLKLKKSIVHVLGLPEK